MRGLDAAFKMVLKNVFRLVYKFDFSKNFCYNIYRKLRKEKLKMNKRFSNSKDSDVDFREGC